MAGIGPAFRGVAAGAIALFVQQYGLMTTRPMNILIVADPIESFKIYKDTTFAMMRELQKRGHRVSSTEPRFMSWRSGQPVTAQVRHLQLTGHADDWYTVHQRRGACAHL